MAKLNQKETNALYQVAELQLHYTHNCEISSRPKITDSRSANEILKSNWGSQIELLEEFNILLLNRNNRVLGLVNISKGGYAGTVVDAKIVFSSALLGKASAIILAHNHPSGNLKPSTQDLAITKKLVEAGKVLDLPIVDHLILTTKSYFSFSDEGLL